LDIGSEGLLSVARPYPVDIEKHRYIEAMIQTAKMSGDQAQEVIYEALRICSV
jgi:hypothetical protein